MNNLHPKFRDRSGRLTPYALACGYVEQDEHEGIRTTLWLEHGCLHVRQHDHSRGERIFWKCPENLKEARSIFDRAKLSARASASASTLAH